MSAPAVCPWCATAFDPARSLVQPVHDGAGLRYHCWCAPCGRTGEVAAVERVTAIEAAAGSGARGAWRTAADRWATMRAEVYAARHAEREAVTLPAAVHAADPVEEVRAASMAEAERVGLYPDPLADRLRARIAAHHRVAPEQVLVGNGCEELVLLAGLAHVGPGVRVVCAAPPFWHHHQVAACLGGTVRGVPLRNWRHNTAAMAALRPEVAFVCNPHNPAGTTVTRDELRELAAASQVLVVDETYVDYADDPDALTAVPLVAGHPVLVLRSLSKAAGIAGARVGYLVGPAEQVARLATIRAPFSVNAFGQAVAERLFDHPGAAKAVAEVCWRRDTLAAALDSIGIDTVPSQANFVVARVDPDREKWLTGVARAAGIGVRSGHVVGLPGTVRLSATGPANMAALVAEASR